MNRTDTHGEGNGIGEIHPVFCEHWDEEGGKSGKDNTHS